MMKSILIFTSFFIFLFSSALALRADVIDLNNGSKIIGKIETVKDGKIYFKTDFAGTLTIDLKDISYLSSEEPLFVSFSKGDRVYGKIILKNNMAQVKMPDGNSVEIKDAMTAVWQKGQPDPLEPQRRKWHYQIGIDIAGKTGNTERFGTGGKASATLEGPADRLMFYLRQAYGKENGEKSDDLLVGGVDYESVFAERHSWYTRIELEKDDIKELDLRSTAALGYGYYFLKKPDHVLRGRSGLMYQHESYQNNDSESTIGLDLGLHHMYKLGDYWEMINDITYTPSIEALSDYRIYHESTFQIPLAGSEIWKLQLGLSNDYDSQPATGKERLETTYFSRLVLDWE